jgi:DNA-binding MarR family transcriptional regulator
LVPQQTFKKGISSLKSCPSLSAKENILDKSVWQPYTISMEKTKNNKHEIAYESLELAFALMELDKKTRYYGTDEPIYHSEIHVIKAIAEHPCIHVGGLADILGVTKGAVSEILRKLERKSLVKKEVDELNLSRYLLSLTEKGEKAHKNHMHYHTILNSMVENELENATDSEIKFLSDFLLGLISKVQNFDENIMK